MVGDIRNVAIALIAGVAAVAALPLTVTAASTLALQKVRTLPPFANVLSSLRPDDEIVIVQSTAVVAPAPPHVLTPEMEFSGLARLEEVAVIEQARPRSFFVMKGTWLNTRVQARVVQTLKTGRLATAPGTTVEFEHEGGELQVKGVIVRSDVGVVFDDAPRYLVGIRREDYRKSSTWKVVRMFAVDDVGTLRPFQVRSGSPRESPLHGMSVSDVAAEIAKRAR